MYDVIIIGAGPAGATLARLLAQKQKVLLLDRRPLQAQLDPPEEPGAKRKSKKNLLSQTNSQPSSPLFREKCCGGLLAPDARTWLSKQGLTLPAAVLDHAQPNVLRAIDLSSSLERIYPCPYINLSRNAFEQWIVSLVPNTVDKLFDCRCLSIEKIQTTSAPEFKLVLRQGETRLTHTCRILIGADGASSKVRNFLGAAPRAATKYLAVQDMFTVSEKQTLKNPALLHEYVALFHPALTDFYGWIIPKGNQLLLGMALPPKCLERRDALKRMTQLREMLSQAGYTFDNRTKREGCFLLRPSFKDIYLGRGGAFLIGEAAGWISPSSAEGYSYAFKSAAALSEAILKHSDPDLILKAYRKQSLPLLGNIAYKQIKSFIMFTPRLRQGIMHSGLLAKV